MNPLISAEELATLKDVVILDARFRLQDPASAEQLFLNGHIPGAQRVDLERDLSGAKTGNNGRHPLPQKAALVALFSSLGIGTKTLVVAYDDADHSGAARLWFLLRWMGHENVRVLNGGLKAWEHSYPLELGRGRVAAQARFEERAPLVNLRDFREAGLLVDARAPERYRGEVEPLDPKAGHIPGARNSFYKELLGADGKFLPAEQLRARLAGLASPTFYCGSGVTACVALLAAEVAGLPGAAIYPGSWSEYCALELPVATGSA